MTKNIDGSFTTSDGQFDSYQGLCKTETDAYSSLMMYFDIHAEQRDFTQDDCSFDFINIGGTPYWIVTYIKTHEKWQISNKTHSIIKI